MQLDQRSEPQPQASRIGRWESGSQSLIEYEARFEVGSSLRVFDPADAVAEIQPLRSFFWHGQQALQSAAQVRSFRYVRFRVRIFAAQEKHRGGGGSGGENVVV